jgi:hypothetical protein
MADVSWNPGVRRTATLTIDASAVHGAAWTSAVTNAIRDLNALFTTHRVNVSLTAGESAVVVVALSSGSYTFRVEGSDQTGTLRTDILHGVTRSIDRITGSTRNREKAYIFLPRDPKVDPAVARSRTVGEPVMRVIIAHEFLHALGLDAHDPGFEGLLAGSWTINEGRRAANDTVSPFGGRARLPPLIFSADTITRLKTMWP